MAGLVTRGWVGWRPQRHELGGVVTVSAVQRDCEWGSVPVDDEVVLAARAGTVDRRRSGVSPPNPVCKQFAPGPRKGPGGGLCRTADAWIPPGLQDLLKERRRCPFRGSR